VDSIVAVMIAWMSNWMFKTGCTTEYHCNYDEFLKVELDAEHLEVQLDGIAAMRSICMWNWML